MAHGTGAAGIVAAGWPGYRRITGIAPAADLVLLPSWGEVVTSIAQAQELGVDVMFHEWNDWHNFQDGTTNVDVAISASTEEGMTQVAPAGNLAGAYHVMEILDLNQDSTTVRLSTDGHGWYTYHAAWITFTWVGQPDDVEISVPNEDGSAHTITQSEGSFSTGQLNFWTEFDRSERGTTKLQVVFDAAESVVPTMDLPFTITTHTNISRIRGLVSDDQSGWGRGMSWIDYVSDHGTALSPATADSVIAVAAYGGSEDWGDFGAPGERRGYSGVGPRPDGQRVIDIASPDDPIAPACHGGDYAVYGRFGGTSGATPHVAGAAALLLGTKEFSTHEDVEEALKNAAR
jgi:subtilisin family serine protease